MYGIANLDRFSSSHVGLQWYGVAPGLGKQWRRKSSGPDLRVDRNDTPAVCHLGGDRVNLDTALFGHRDEVERRRAAPVENLSIKLETHLGTIPTTCTGPGSLGH